VVSTVNGEEATGMARRLVVLGAGTAGTMVVNQLRRRLDRKEWEILVVDQDDRHLYQPGLLFVPFGGYRPEQLVKPRRRFVPDGVELVLAGIDRVDPDHQQVLLADGRRLGYDYLVVATGTSPRPDATPGMLGPQWRRSIFDFYTLDGATALAAALDRFESGRLVVHITDIPIKCPVAPLEFAFLADAYLRERRRRDRVEISYVTPLSGAFTKPVASARLGSMLADRQIAVTPDFLLERIDDQRKVLISYDEREVPFDLLVTVPLNLGADYLARSGLGNELNYLPVDLHTLRSRKYDTIFAIGDANDLPTSKAGSTAHFSVEVFVENFVALAAGRPMTASFDGHANCFVESGNRRGLLIDFNYQTEPLPGSYPVPVLGPFDLLAETRRNHWGKLAFRWLYWHLLLPGHRIPLPTRMSMAGKRALEPAGASRRR
jgi:sulfide:quinone oxidoreductase